jgi:hypothetical protein
MYIPNDFPIFASLGPPDRVLCRTPKQANKQDNKQKRFEWYVMATCYILSLVRLNVSNVEIESKNREGNFNVSTDGPSNNRKLKARNRRLPTVHLMPQNSYF